MLRVAVLRRAKRSSRRLTANETVERHTGASLVLTVEAAAAAGQFATVALPVSVSTPASGCPVPVMPAGTVEGQILTAWRSAMTVTGRCAVGAAGHHGETVQVGRT